MNKVDKILELCDGIDEAKATEAGQIGLLINNLKKGDVVEVGVRQSSSSPVKALKIKVTSDPVQFSAGSTRVYVEPVRRPVNQKMGGSIEWRKGDQKAYYQTSPTQPMKPIDYLQTT